jgi:hypothetical protein
MKHVQTPTTYTRYPLAFTSSYPNAYAAAVKAEKNKDGAGKSYPAWPLAYRTISPHAYAAAVKEARKAYRSHQGGFIARPSA